MILSTVHVNIQSKKSHTKPQCNHGILCMIHNTAPLPLVGGRQDHFSKQFERMIHVQITLGCWSGVGLNDLKLCVLGLGVGSLGWGDFFLTDIISVWVVLVIKHRCHVTAQPCTYVSSLLKYKPGRTPHATTERPHEDKNTGVSKNTNVTCLVTNNKINK